MKKEVFPIHTALIIGLITNVTTDFLWGNDFMTNDLQFLISQNSTSAQTKEMLIRDKLNSAEFSEQLLSSYRYRLPCVSFLLCNRNVIACKICVINHF